MEKRSLLVYVLLISLIIIDLLTKSYFLGKNFSIMPDILEITPVKNTGIAFGLFKGSFFFTIILPIIAIIALFYFFYKRKKPITQISLSFAISGLVGNLISRFVYGYVPDFISIPFLSFVFQVFNFADLYLFVGIIMLVISVLKEK